MLCLTWDSHHPIGRASTVQINQGPERLSGRVGPVPATLLPSLPNLPLSRPNLIATHMNLPSLTCLCQLPEIPQPLFHTQ